MSTKPILRPATHNDAESIRLIHSHYVHNTVATFSLIPKTTNDVIEEIEETKTAGLPYIVAVEGGSDNVVGYCSAHGFRSSKGGYIHTVELSLFISHEYRGRGVGSDLLGLLLDVLRQPEAYQEYCSAERRECAKVKVVIACMSIDVSGYKAGYGVKEFYEKFSFREVGHLKEVGYKFGRW